MRTAVQVYRDGLRDKTYHADGVYDDRRQAAEAAFNALNEPAVSEVRLVIVADE